MSHLERTRFHSHLVPFSLLTSNLIRFSRRLDCQCIKVYDDALDDVRSVHNKVFTRLISSVKCKYSFLQSKLQVSIYGLSNITQI
jgi:hypothetical protein